MKIKNCTVVYLDEGDDLHVTADAEIAFDANGNIIKHRWGKAGVIVSEEIIKQLAEVARKI